MQSVSRRSRNKLEKRERIISAAWALFRSQGFEATTTKQIAERADIATGTLFTYAANKDQLLIMLYEETLQRLSQETTHKASKQTGDVSKALLGVFAPLFEFYAQDRELSRHFVNRFIAAGPGAPQSATQEFLTRLTGLIAAAQERGQLRADFSAAQAAINCFALYYATLTAFLTSDRSARAAVKTLLKPALELQLRGLLPEGR